MSQRDQGNRSFPAARQPILLVAFVLSGSTALMYELVWTRAASTWFGVSAYAISTILAAFMVGLAVGGWLGGECLRRFSGIRPLRAYAVVEICVGVSALALQLLIGHADPAMAWIAHHFPGFGLQGIVIRFGAVAALLTLPTLLMGASFPLFTHGFTRGTRSAQRGISLAYGANVLGAALGCALTGWVLLQALGMRRTVLLAAGLNVVAALVALAVDHWASRPAPASGPSPARPASRPRQGPSSAWLIGLVSLSGCSAMAYEVLWSRMYRQVFPLLNPFLAFATVLTIILLGMALGSLLLAFQDRTWITSSARGRLILFAAIQLSIGLLVVVSLADVRWAIVRGVVRGEAQAWSGAVHFAALCPSALLLGLCFPLLSSVYADRLEDLGARLGQIYASSTVAGVVGSVLGGFVLIPRLGLHSSLLLLGAVNVTAASLALVAVRRPGRWGWVLVPLVAGGLLALGWSKADQRPEFSYQGDLVFLHDGLEASTAVTYKSQHPAGYRLYSNGQHIFSEDRRAEGTHGAAWTRVIGPALLAPDASRVLLVGFGTGHSAQHLLDSFPDLHLDCVELDENQAATTPYFGTQALLEDPRFHLFFEDGRQFLIRAEASYDLIIIDSWGQTTNQEFYNVDLFHDAASALASDGTFYVKLPRDLLDRPHEVDVLLHSAAQGFAYPYVLNAQDLFPGIVGRNTAFDAQGAGPSGDIPEDLYPLYRAVHENIWPIDAEVLARTSHGQANSDDRPFFFGVGLGRGEPDQGYLERVLAGSLR